MWLLRRDLTSVSLADMQEGDLACYLKDRASELLSENEVMLKFVQIALALQNVHDKVWQQKAPSLAGILQGSISYMIDAIV